MLGNTKLGMDTLIFNMGSATDCPSKALGLCKLCRVCYALKAERLYPGCLPYRTRQQGYWLKSDLTRVLHDFVILLSKGKRAQNIKYLRLNESGDFHTQACVEKAELLARHLKALFGIKTYTYSARSDLDFSNCRALMVKGSGHDKGNNGRTIARPKAMLAAPNHVTTTIDGHKYFVCPADCRKCTMCKEHNNLNIVFAIH